MNHAGNGFDHCERELGLENVTSHVDSGSSALNRVVGEFERFELRKLLTTGDDNRNRCASDNVLESFRVISLNDASTVLSTDT